MITLNLMGFCWSTLCHTGHPINSVFTQKNAAHKIKSYILPLEQHKSKGFFFFFKKKKLTFRIDNTLCGHNPNIMPKRVTPQTLA
jgi:hypothetical protein